MRKTLFTGLILLMPGAAFAQAPAAPAEKPADKPADAAAPAPAAPAAPEAAPAPAEPAPAPAATTEATATVEMNATGTASTTEATATADTNAAAAPAGEPAVTAAPSPVSRRGQDVEDESAWKFGFSGYLRAPMRLGIGKRLATDPNNSPPVEGASETTLHEPNLPDDQYLSFQSSPHNKRSWAEMFFSYGNALATGTVGVMAYNLTEASFNDVDAQVGISQAYVTLTPDLGYENMRLWWKAGAIVDKYGMSGRYDAGEYDMYMFGRTHVMGETIHLDYDLTDAWTLYVEHGLGTKRPDPNQYNNARFTMLHHAHVGVKQDRDLEFGAHYMSSWSQEEYRPSAAQDASGARNNLPDGSLWVVGAEARAELGAFGYIYGAFSHVNAESAITVSRAIEVLHASGGGEYNLGIVGNYLDSPGCELVPTAPEDMVTAPTPAPQNWVAPNPNGCSDGTGTINALHAQYEFSLTNYLDQSSGGQRFWGRGTDLKVALYGMLAMVDSEAIQTADADGPLNTLNTRSDNYKVTKMKFGADVLVQVLPWLSPAVRFDRIMPNDKIPEQSFAILSPRLEFKSQWITHERITLQYSRYLYDERECLDENGQPASTASIDGYRCVQPPSAPVPYDGWGSTPGDQDAGTRATGSPRPDENVIKIEATMWW
jgi:hypothetical protein